jgi:hypothetical protein
MRAETSIGRAHNNLRAVVIRRAARVGRRFMPPDAGGCFFKWGVSDPPPRAHLASRSRSGGSLTPRLGVRFVRTIVTGGRIDGRSRTRVHTPPLVRLRRALERLVSLSLVFPGRRGHAADQTTDARKTTGEAPHEARPREQRDAVCVRAIPGRVDGVRDQPGHRHRAREGQRVCAMAGDAP